ncbi:MAG: Ig-like domain-containing protein [Caryophanon sp.]|nr:Ig-like domain-containing protein [Caryophanon sp.]
MTIRICVLLCTLFFIICPSTQAADVSSTKAWTITFSQPLDEQSLSSASIQIQTPSGQLHPTRLTQLDDMTVQLSPLTPYKESGTYNISITNVRSIHDQLITPYTTSFTFIPVPKATWIWNAYNLTEADAQFLISEGVTKVYVQVESELSHEAYVPFFNTLQQHNIAIYALEGFAGLQFQDDEKTERFLHWVTQFQQQYGYFTGIHIDVEPYTDPSWQQNEQQLLEQYFFYIQKF